MKGKPTECPDCHAPMENRWWNFCAWCGHTLIGLEHVCFSEKQRGGALVTR